MKHGALIVLPLLLGLCLAVVTPAQSQHARNPPLLGLIVVPAEPPGSGVQVVSVLDRSPAQRAQLHDGDLLTQIGDASIGTPEELDATLARYRPGQTVDLHLVRDGADLQLQATLADQMASRGTVLRGRNRGTTGFESPGWYAYAWANVAAGTEPPTAQNTAGKVVVIHSFQSW